MVSCTHLAKITHCYSSLTYPRPHEVSTSALHILGHVVEGERGSPVGVEFSLVVMFKNRLGKALPWDRLSIVDFAVELGNAFDGVLQSSPLLFS